jgi:hypothetical protein
MPDILVNRAPVLTLWATVVARRLGYNEEEALTLGKAVAGQTAAAKGKRLGLYAGKTTSEAETLRKKRQDLGAGLVEFMGRAIPCLRTDGGLRALDETRPTDPEVVRRYLASKFGEALSSVRDSLEALAAAHAPTELERAAMDLYVQFRPSAPPGASGWGQRGRLDLDGIEQLATARRRRGS